MNRETLSDKYIPQGKIGWSQSGNLLTQNTNASISLQANFPRPDVYTVQFNVANPGVGYRPQATIKWSVEGNDVQRIIDVGAGVSISGVGQAVKVTMVDAFPVGGGSPNTPYPASIQVSPGVRANIQRPPVLFEQHVTIAPGAASALIPVPLNAGVVSCLVTARYQVTNLLPLAGVNFQTVVEILNPSGLNQTYYAALSDPEFVALSPTATTIQVKNLATAPGDAFISIYWGIDG